MYWHFAFIYQDQLMDLLLLIMPGKTKATIESATGRDRLWEQILYFAAQKPCSDGALLVPNAWYRSKAPCFHPMLITTT